MFRHSRKKLWENISKILSKVGISVQGIGRDSGSCICYLILIKFLQRSELDWQLLHGRKRQSSTHWDFAVQCEHWLPSWFPHRYKHCPDLSDIVRLPKPWPPTSEALEWQDTQRTENWKDPVVQLQVKWSELFGQMDHGFFLPKFSADPNGERGHFQLCVWGTPRFWAEHSSATIALSPCDLWKWVLHTERCGKNTGLPWPPDSLIWKTVVERECWGPGILFSLHLWREVAPCDLVMKGCEHTAHCQTNCNTVIEILILLSPSISVSANILRTCSFFEKERAREKRQQGDMCSMDCWVWDRMLMGGGVLET